MPRATKHSAPSSVSLEPYPGPRPFRIDETPLFHGRGRDTAQVRSLVLGHSLVVLYAESGAGKTSLLNAGLIPACQKKGVTVYPSARIRPSIRGGELEVRGLNPNPFASSIAANWALEQDREISGTKTLADFLRYLEDTYDAPPDEPRVFIIDQFEELFTQFPEHWGKRVEFFEQLQEALDRDANLRVLLAMREDYLAQTEPYVGLVANRLQHRFRLERLRRDEALSATTGPLEEAGRRFAPGAAEYLVDQLLQTRIERPEGPVEIIGEFVEPVQLQIVCRSLWDRVDRKLGVGEITKEHIDRYGQVDRALARFYGDLVVRVAAATDLDEFELRGWCEERLITAGGTRALVYGGVETTEGLPNAVIRLLESEHLIRGEERSGAHWYELSHDKFVGAIQSGNRQAFEESVDLATQRDMWGRTVDETIVELRSDDDDTVQRAIDSILPLVASRARLPEERQRTLESLLSQVASDRDNLTSETRRKADFARTFIADDSWQQDEAFSRAAYRAVSLTEVSLVWLVVGLVTISALYYVSMLSIVSLAERIMGIWSAPELAGHMWAITGTVVVWVALYGRETFENFPLEGWRRSSRQLRHTLTAPFVPRWGGVAWVAIWPLNVLIPTGLASTIATVSYAQWGWSFDWVFWAALATTTLILVGVYWSSEF